MPLGGDLIVTGGHVIAMDSAIPDGRTSSSATA